MTFGVRVKVWGDLASFTRPEMKVERVSYEVMTPGAARGILEAIYWKPQIRWVVDRIRVLAPLRFTHIRRNEIDAKISVDGARGVAAAHRNGRGALGINVEDHRQQRAAMILRDVCYGIEAHVEVTEREEGDGRVLDSPEAKHLRTFKDRASKGQCFHHPYLGCREFPASFELVDEFPECPGELKGERHFGYMLHSITFVPDPKGSVVERYRGRRLRAEPLFFEARMRDGVMDVPDVVSLATAQGNPPCS